jgi:hypothetical protein
MVWTADDSAASQDMGMFDEQALPEELAGQEVVISETGALD